MARVESEMRTGHSRPTSSTNGDGGPPQPSGPSGDGDPGCKVCGGLGWIRHDVPVGHSDFGKAFPCECIKDRVAERRLANLRRASALAAMDRLTFESFQVDAPGNTSEGRRSLAAALEAATAFARSPRGWLVFHGGYGCGKTHLAAAIVNDRLRSGATALFLVVPDLLDHLRGGFASESDQRYDDRIDSVREAPVLVLDDFGAESPTPWAGEKLFQILNHRYNTELPTVITTNQDLDELDERLRSRLGHFGFVKLFEIKAIDYRGGVPAPDRGLTTLDLYDDMTFQSWQSRAGDLEADQAENLARGFAVARAFAEEPSGWLVLTGDNGCGKTHLAAAIANHFLGRAAATANVLFVTVPDLLDYLRATFSPTTRVRYDQRFDEIREAELLVLDDLGTESATAWAREKLFQILNHRYAARLPTVVTMSILLQDVHPWLRTRMLDRRRCTVFEILAPPYGLRSGGRGSATGRSPSSRGRRR